MSDRTLHLSLPVHDLEVARHFYVDILGCDLGRVGPNWIDVWFYGLQLTLHHRPNEVREPVEQGVLHFGVALEDAAFRTVLDRLSAHDVGWLSEPVLHEAQELSGKVGGKLADPSGNVIEIKHYDDGAKFEGRG